jgi:hypothetical protein
VDLGHAFNSANTLVVQGLAADHAPIPSGGTGGTGANGTSSGAETTPSNSSGSAAYMYAQHFLVSPLPHAPLVIIGEAKSKFICHVHVTTRLILPPTVPIPPPPQLLWAPSVCGHLSACRSVAPTTEAQAVRTVRSPRGRTDWCWPRTGQSLGLVVVTRRAALFHLPHVGAHTTCRCCVGGRYCRWRMAGSRTLGEGSAKA